MSISNTWLRMNSYGTKALLCAVLASIAMLTGSAFAAAPANDDFASAIALSGSTAIASGNSTGATADTGQPAFLGTSSVWYSWTAPSSGTVAVSTAGSSFDTKLGVYTGTAVNALTPVLAGENDNYGGIQSQVVFVATAGTVYQIGISGSSAEVGFFNLGIALVTAPANDNLANATDLGSAATFSVPGDTTYATAEAGELFNGIGRTIWYKWTAPSTGSFQFNTNDSAIHVEMQVFTGATFPLTYVTNNYDAFQLDATAGTVYLIQMDAVGIGGPLLLNLAARPANDDFANATDLGNVATFTAIGDNTGATNQSAAGELGLGDSLTIWYKWTAPFTGSILLDNSTSDLVTDAKFSMFTGTAINTLTYVKDAIGNDVNTDSGAVSVPVTNGTVYYFQMSSSSGTSGKLALSLPMKPANDDFANALNLGNVSSFSASGTTAGATSEVSEVLHGQGNTVWYKWTSSTNRIAQIDTYNFSNIFNNNSYTNTQISIFTAGTPDTLANLTPFANGNISVSANFTAGTVYYISVDATNPSDRGGFLLNLKAPPANDNFANAAAIQPKSNQNGDYNYYDSFVFGDNTNASKETGEPNHGNDPGGASVWYTFTPPIATSISVSYNSQSGNQMDVAVYTGSVVNALTLVAQTVSPLQNGTITFPVAAGVPYKIAVDQKNNTFGSFYLQVVTAPPNDNFVNRIVETGPTFTVLGTTNGATSEALEPTTGYGQAASVWYSWTAPSTGTYLLALSSNYNSNQSIDVFTGTTLAALTNVSSSPALSTNFSAVSGTVYQIRISRPLGSGSDFSLSLLTLPPNDNFASAIVLTGATFDVTGYNFGATLEAGEPNFAQTVENSVWYSWTAPANQHVTVTVQSDYSDSLQIFTGTSVGALTQVTTDQNGPFNNICTFDAVAGTVYKFQVGGSINSTDNAGTFNLVLHTPPPNDNFANAIQLTGSFQAVNGTILAATKESGEPVHAGFGIGTSVWYKWTAPAAGQVLVSFTNSDFPPVIAVYTGSTVNALTQVEGGIDEATFAAVAGTTYSIAIDSFYTNEAGDFTFQLGQAPVNDNFVNAIDLTGPLPVVTTGTNVLATKEVGEPNNAGVSYGYSVWWKYTAAADGEVEVSTIGSYVDTTLGVYTGSTVSALTLVASNDNINAGLFNSTVQFSAAAGTTYYILVDSGGYGYGNSQGLISLSLKSVLPASSPLTATPSMPNVGQEVTFTVGSSGAATYAWNFGDGSTSITTTASVTHTYTTVGTFTVTVVATLGNGTTVTNTATVTVSSVRNFRPATNKFTLAFSKPNTDSIRMTEYIPFDGPMPTGAAPITITIGGLTDTFTLTKGKIKLATKSVTVVKPSAGTVNGKITIVYTKGDFQDVFAPLGLTQPAIKNKTVKIPVQIVFNGVSSAFTLNLLYTSTGKKGMAK